LKAGGEVPLVPGVEGSLKAEVLKKLLLVLVKEFGLELLRLTETWLEA
jgi:hypothetical protein